MSLDDARRVPGLGVAFRSTSVTPSARTRRRWEKQAQYEPEHIRKLIAEAT